MIGSNLLSHVTHVHNKFSFFLLMVEETSTVIGTTPPTIIEANIRKDIDAPKTRITSRRRSHVLIISFIAGLAVIGALVVCILFYFFRKEKAKLSNFSIDLLNDPEIKVLQAKHPDLLHFSSESDSSRRMLLVSPGGQEETLSFQRRFLFFMPFKKSPPSKCGSIFKLYKCDMTKPLGSRLDIIEIDQSKSKHLSPRMAESTHVVAILFSNDLKWLAILRRRPGVEKDKWCIYIHKVTYDPISFSLVVSSEDIISLPLLASVSSGGGFSYDSRFFFINEDMCIDLHRPHLGIFDASNFSKFDRAGNQLYCTCIENIENESDAQESSEKDLKKDLKVYKLEFVDAKHVFDFKESNASSVEQLENSCFVIPEEKLEKTELVINGFYYQPGSYLDKSVFSLPLVGGRHGDSGSKFLFLALRLIAEKQSGQKFYNLIYLVYRVEHDKSAPMRLCGVNFSENPQCYDLSSSWICFAKDNQDNPMVFVEYSGRIEAMSFLFNPTTQQSQTLEKELQMILQTVRERVKRYPL